MFNQSYFCGRCGSTNSSPICPACAVVDSNKAITREQEKNRDQAEMFERKRREREEEQDRQIQFNRNKLHNTENQSYMVSDFQSNNILDSVDKIRDKLWEMGYTDQVINAVVLDIVLPQLRQGLYVDLIGNNIAEYIDLHFPNNKKRPFAVNGSDNLISLFSKLIRLFIFICSSFAHAFVGVFSFDAFFSIKEPGATEFFLAIFIVISSTYFINKIDNKHGFVEAIKNQFLLFGGIILSGAILLGSTGKLN